MNLNSLKIAPSIASLVIGAIFFIASLELNFDQGYNDFVVGNVAWYAGNKFQDLVAWPVFIIFSSLAFLSFSRIYSELNTNYGSEVAENYNLQLILWSIPFYSGVATLFLGGSIHYKTAIISALGITSLSVIAFYKRRLFEKSDPDFWSVMLLVALLISLVPIEIAVLLSRAPISLIGDLKINYFFELSDAFLVLVFASVVYLIIRHEKKFDRYLVKLFFVAQIGLPLFFFTLYPSRILQSSGELIKYDTTLYLKLLVTGLVSYGLYDVIKRFKSSSGERDWRQYFSPFAIFSLAVALKWGGTQAPHISADDYHFGESLLGWWSYLQGFVPYVDYMPAHGIVEDDLRSIFSYIFYDGTAATLADAGRLTFAVVGFFAFIAIYRYTGSLLLAFALILLLGGRLAWFFFVPFICLWLMPSLRAQPGKWLSIWMLTAPVVILGVPPQGLILVVVFGILAVKIAWDQIQLGDKKSWRRLGLVTGVVLLIFSLTPISLMLFGAIRYVMENGSINQISYGVPWALSWNIGGSTGWVLELIRMSWVGATFFCLYIISNEWRNFKDSKNIFYAALIFFLFLIFLIPYSMGRIDGGGPSRPGLSSIFSWAIIFPLLMWGVSNKKLRIFGLLTAVFMSSLVGFGVNSFSGISSVAYQKINSPQLRNYAAVGFTNIGSAYIEERHWDRISRLNKLLRLRLSESESYLDLTSRNAHYFYLNRFPVIPITAPYNIAPENQQRRAVEFLENSPPKIALLQADNIVHDGGGLALRSHYLYRFVMNNYIPRMESGFIVGYLKSGVKEKNNSEITAEIKNTTNEIWLNGFGRRDSSVVLSDSTLTAMLKVGDKVRLANGDVRVVEKISPEESSIWLNGGLIEPSDNSFINTIDVIVNPGIYQEYISSLFHRAFSVSDFKKIPVSWGRSEKSLKAKMISPIVVSKLSSSTFDVSLLNGSYKIEGNDPQVIFDVSALGIDGRNSGLLKFNFDCIHKTSDSRLQIFWWGNERNAPFEASSVRFTAENGTLIVPLDASPWWTGLRQIKGIRFDLDNASSCQAFSVENITLYERE